MKICILSSFEDSMQKDTGPSVRIYNLAKGLAANGNAVNVIIPKQHPTSQLIDGIAVQGLRGFLPVHVLKVFKKLVNVGRTTALYFYDPLFIFRAMPIMRDSDVVQIEQQSSAGLLIPFIKRVLKKPVVVDCHDVFQASRVKHTSVLRRLLETFLEKLAYRNSDLLLTVSELERKRLVSAISCSRNVIVVPNGVATSAFAKSSKHKELEKKYHLENSRVVVFVGNLDYPPNREAMHLLSSKIAPKVLSEVQDVRFLVVGRSRDKLYLPNLIYTGFVHNVSDILNLSDVAVAPLLHGSGTRLKILEYFSCTLPVVSTSLGAEGLDVADGVNIFIEDDFERFALRIVELLNDQNLSRSIGNAARILAVNSYDWKHITNELETNLQVLISDFNGSRDLTATEM